MKQINATAIKVIAIFAMTLDHIAYTFVPYDTATYYIMRLIGRLTAPLMCFFLAEGFKHTHDRKKYLLRLCCFAAVTQPIYYVFFYHSYPKNMFTFITHMNVMFTLAVALLVLIIVTSEKLPSMYKIILAVVVSSFAQLGDWSLLVPAWTLIFFFFNRDKKKMYLAFFLCSLTLLPYLLLKQFDSFASFSYNYAVLLALIPITMYNGQRISNSSLLKKKISKWFFYIYYPLHMMILYLIFIKV